MRTGLFIRAALLAAVLCTIGAAPVMAGAPAIQWENLLGGSDWDFGYSVQQASDGGYILLGRSSSNATGDVTGTNHGTTDYWVAKLNGAGAIAWQKLLGGSDNEEGDSVQQTADGGYILAGYSYSSASGNVTGATHGNGDLWAVKLDSDAPLVAVPGGAGVPGDSNGDGLYDDVNGNERPDFADVVLYFNQMHFISVYEPVTAFDYNANQRIDFADVVWLFVNL
jgi:PKD repeat protein